MLFLKIVLFIGCWSPHFCLKSLEGGDVDVSDQSVQFVGGILIFVTHTSQTNTNPEGNIPAKNELE